MSSKSDQTQLAAVLEELVDVGFFLQHAVAGTVAQTVFFSAYGIFFAVALYSIFRKGLKFRAGILMLVVVVYLYVASAAQWTMNLWVTLTKIHGFLMVDVPFPDRAKLAEVAILKVVGVQEAIFDFNMSVGDSVVVWRTWAVYQHRAQRRILVILLRGTLLLLTFIFSVIDTACSNYDGPLPGVCYQAGAVGWGLSAATNLTCTIFIGLKARQHRKITQPLGKPSRILLWLIQVISFFASAQIITLTSPAVYLWGVISAMGNQMAGFYPTLVIVIVNLRRTIWEEEEESTRALRWTPNSRRSGMTDSFGSRGDDTVFDITSDKTFVDARKYPRV
ncbi:hypothetical protein B0H11DRAFT_2022964 [Mycena galericulata]|nr:hypothetical protein B0H11DRAFT_2022964 [Mycena galericulata]